MKTCSRCKETKSFSEFSRHRGRADGHQAYCKQCHNTVNKTVYRENAQRVWDYLKDNPCTKCGESDPRVLEFDHRGDDVKVANVAQMIVKVRSWKAIQDEIAKCDVLCANCHRRKTYEQLGWTTYD